MLKNYIYPFLLLLFFTQCGSQNESKGSETSQKEPTKAPFTWKNANVYFLLTDRFHNADTTNDINFDRTGETGKLRGFKGGDIKGITEKIQSGYFDNLGINAIWFSPVMEQIHGKTDEGTGDTYAYHGYWTRDWTSLEPNFGNEEDLKKMVEEAHNRGIRVIMDVIINHTGPVTDQDPVWPDGWVRTEPQCAYDSYENTISCTLVENLPDIRTDSNEEVELPEFLKEKWKKEGRLDKEMKELDVFFTETGYPRAPRFYIIKWLVDLIKKYGVDGFRVDTAKHTEESVWAELYKEALKAFEDWKKQNPEKVLDDNEFFMVGEVYGYNISSLEEYSFGDSVVNYFDNGFNSLINFEFKADAQKPYEEIFSKYSQILNGPLQGKTVLNYVSSHDDSGPFDKERQRVFESGTKLLLCPGGSQVYYGDETGRPLMVDGAVGDANLRSLMNWDELETNTITQKMLNHWQKLGRFRNDHPAIGAGVHEMISESPYFFKRTFEKGNFSDKVIVGLDIPEGKHELNVEGVFEKGEIIKDYYSGNEWKIEGNKLMVEAPDGIVLLAN